MRSTEHSGRRFELTGVYAASGLFIALGLACLVFARPLGRLHSRMQRKLFEGIYGQEAIAQAQPPFESVHPEVGYAWAWRLVGLIEIAFGLWVLIEFVASKR